MKKANIALSIALVLLCFSGIAATFTIVRLYDTEALVSHTYTVEVAVGDLESTWAEVGRHRVAYVASGTAQDLGDFNRSTQKLKSVLARIRQLTSDNSSQAALCDLLDANAERRMVPSLASVRLKQQGKNDPTSQLQLTSEVAKAAFETASISQQMRQNEDLLLERRSRLSHRLFTVTLLLLIASFASSAFMFWVHYRLLNRELKKRGAAEHHLRQLSGHLIRVQDDERRRFARELHDGLGQDIVAAKITADFLLARHQEDVRLKDLAALLDASVTQIRAISYLLHPPLLDEVGLASAAKWLIEGYTKRSGVDVSFDISAQQERMPPYLELALFRILQEGLTNIQRHSKSARAEISIQIHPHEVALSIRDYGKGIPPETLANLRANGNHAGVGLAGITERVRELGGELKIKSDPSGTEISAKMPIVPELELSSSDLLS